MRFLLRFGPSPETTEDADGNLHAEFTDFAFFEAPADVSLNLNTRVDNDEFVRAIVAPAWREVVKNGHGHMLIGLHDGFEYILSPADCRTAAWGEAANNLPFAPRNYRLLFAVSRIMRPPDAPPDLPPHADMAVDYRGSSGPGDPALTPAILVLPES